MNIAFADLLTGLIADPTSVNFHIKEALQAHIPVGEIYLLHVSLFIADAIALITMTLLSFDRIIALVYPMKYHIGIEKWKENVVVVLIYPISILLVVPYFRVGFIRQLAVFTAINVSVAIISLVTTVAVYRNNSKKKIFRGNTFKDRDDSQTNQKTSEPESKKDLEDSINSASLIRMQNKVTRTFFIMVCLFIAMYLPACVTMLYMNTCGESCNCKAVHIMRDISYVIILASSAFRPLNFLLTLGQLRRYTVNFLLRKNTKKVFNIQ